MSSAVERLAEELAKLPPDEWTKLGELRRAAEMAERLGEIERDPVTPTNAADEEAIDETPKVIVRSWDQA